MSSPTTTNPVANPGSDRFSSGRGQPSDGLGQCQARPDRPLGVILMSPRVAEVGEHAVPHVLGDVPLEARYLASYHLLVFANRPTHLLRIEPRRQLGRADQVAEQDSELAALSFGGSRPDGVLGRMGG